MQDRTQLTRRSIQLILQQSGRLKEFKRNPQQVIEQTAEAINRCKRLAIVDGIKYQRLKIRRVAIFTSAGKASRRGEQIKDRMPKVDGHEKATAGVA